MDVRSRNVDDLSGGELQRFAIAMMCIQKGDMLVNALNQSFKFYCKSGIHTFSLRILIIYILYYYYFGHCYYYF